MPFVLLLAATAPVAGCSDASLTGSYKNTDPEATITQPGDGAEVLEYSSLTVTAAIADHETAMADLVVTWLLDGVAAPGVADVTDSTGTLLIADGLAPGSHELSVTVVDGDGASASDAAAVQVVSNDAPVVAFIHPSENGADVYDSGAAISVDGVVTDSEDQEDLSVVGLTWDLDGIAYAGPSSANADGTIAFELAGDLEVGSHSLTATPADSWGEVGSARTVTFAIETADGDGDGYGLDDCDDSDPYVNPGAAEVCNAADDDCDGAVDEGLDTTWYRDDDGDAFGEESVVQSACEQPAGYAFEAGDCDDTDGGVNPRATEACDEIDNDCDGDIDEGGTSTFYADSDGDTYGDPSVSATGCSAAAGYVADATDCDDGDDAVNPRASEVCNAIDDDCDGDVDEDGTSTFYADADGDSYGDAAASVTGCTASAGYVADATDCDDGDGAVNPAAYEVCNTIDDDCDGDVDEGVLSTFYADMDGDGYGDPSSTSNGCSAPAGYVTDASDCDDTDAGAPTIWYADADGDGYGDPTTTTESCSEPAGYVANGDDPDDTDATDPSPWSHPVWEGDGASAWAYCALGAGGGPGYGDPGMMAAWVRLVPGDSGGMLMDTDGADVSSSGGTFVPGNHLYSLQVEPETLTFCYSSNSTYYGYVGYCDEVVLTTSLADSQWHLVMVYYPSSSVYYVDGIWVGAGSATLAINNNSGTGIGARWDDTSGTSSSYFGGQIAEVGVWTDYVALSTVAGTSLETASGDESAVWQADGTSFTDVSGNGNTCTAYP